MTLAVGIGLSVLALVVGLYGSVTGAGGGFLMVAGLVLFFDLSGAEAVGTSVITTVVIQLVAGANFSRAGLVDVSTTQWFVLGSIPVAFVSSAVLASRIPERTFNIAIGILLLALAAFVILRPASTDTASNPVSPHRPQLIGVGSAMGVLSGAFGVGAGLVTVPTIQWLQKLPTHRAAATTSVIGACSGVAATIGHTIAGNPRWSYAPFVIGGAVVGGNAGSRSAAKVPPRVVLLLLAGGLLATGVPLLIRGL